MNQTPPETAEDRAYAAGEPAAVPPRSAAPRLLPYLQLLRIPLVFTAIANVAMGFFITTPGYQGLSVLALLILSSCSLYLAGMVLNDVFDVEKDRLERPHRPIPSGRVSARAALVLGFSLLLAGIALGLAVCFVTQSLRAGVIASVLALCIVLYDAGLKKTWLGPAAMGGCRMLNVFLGMSAATDGGGKLRPWTPAEWTVAAGIGVYVAGVTWFARTEARESERGQLIAALAVIVGGLGLLASLPEWQSLSAPRAGWYALWAILAVFVGQACVAAVREPSPSHVQRAVKRCLMSLLLLDATILYGIRGPALAAAVLLLIIPQKLLGRYVYST